MNPIHKLPIDPYQEACVEAANRGVMTARVLIEKGTYVANIHPWLEPVLSHSNEAQLEKPINLINDNNLLTELAQSISDVIQFPVNTIFAHSLGVLASAMSKSFSFEYGSGVKPVNLYMVTAQPPSSGKSGVNDILTEPVHIAFEEINKAAIVERKKIMIRIGAIKAEIKNATTEAERFALEDQRTEQYELLAKHVVYTYAVDDATPEGTAKMALAQKGVFNIISAEADAINVILGGVYSDKPNFGVFLKGWDYERHQVARSGDGILAGHLNGCVAVIAQDESIKTILAAGEKGRGISERFLIVREPTKLGTRKFVGGRKIDPVIISQYHSLIHNIVRDAGTTLKFSDKAMDLINDYRLKVEPEMGDEGKYGNNMMRGFIGKVDKQVLKIASILHVADEWQEGGTKSSKVNISTVRRALNIFKAIAESYISAADELGYTGDESEYKKIEEKLTDYMQKNKAIITLSQLRDNIKNVKPFTGTPRLSKKLTEILLPVAEQNGLCVVHNGKIYINPHLKG